MADILRKETVMKKARSLHQVFHEGVPGNEHVIESFRHAVERLIFNETKLSFESNYVILGLKKAGSKKERDVH